jgi:chromate reductase, NAD(P)H dehydrogenase (quinone)
MVIFGISGSLRRDSHNSALLRAAAALAPEGVEIEIYDQLAAIPPFNEDEEDAVGGDHVVAHLRDAVARADGVFIVTPEYNSSIPGVLKNAIDWLSRPVAETVLRNKPAVVIGASTGMFGAVWSQAETRKVLGAAGARVVDLELPVPTAHEQFHDDGHLLDSDLETQVREAVQALVDAIAQRRQAAA